MVCRIRIQLVRCAFAACALSATAAPLGGARASEDMTPVESRQRAAASAGSHLCAAVDARKPDPSGKLRLVIATGGTGGVFFPYGGGLARVLSARLPDAEVTAEVTGGSVDNNKLLLIDQAD